MVTDSFVIHFNGIGPGLPRGVGLRSGLGFTGFARLVLGLQTIFLVFAGDHHTRGFPG